MVFNQQIIPPYHEHSLTL